MEKKKILFLIGSLNRDGASTWQLTLVKYLDYTKYDGHLVVFTEIFNNSRVDKMLSESQAKITVLHAPKHKLNPLYYAKLHCVVKDYQPDLVVNCNPQLTTIVRLIAKMNKTKNVTVYQVKIDSLKSIIKLQEKLSRHLSDKFVGVSTEVKNELPEIPARDKFAIFNTVESNTNPIDKQKYIKKYQLENANRIFLNVARYHPQKNQENLIRGFAAYTKKNPDDVLLITGWGDLEEKLRKTIIEEKAEKNIHLTGPVDDIWNKFAIADYFVMSSYFEGLPLASAEAVSFGLPMLLTDIGEFRDITDGNAVFIDGFEPQNIEEGFNKILEISPKQYQQMSKRSLEIYQENFEAANMARKYEEVFETAIRD